MWTAIVRAVDMLLARPNDNQKWIVVLTDGASNRRSLATARDRLRLPQAASINVLAITVNLRPAYRDTIHAACVQGRTGHNDIIPADGNHEALAAAWVAAGEHMTVSKKIEQNDLSDTECHELLATCMQLREREMPWSMMKQAHWVQYVHRRCGILRASEKFNKNVRFAHFGSTTMRVMLEEAEHALSDDYRHDWGSHNHQQFIYWKEGEDTKWSLIATQPSAMSNERKQLLLDLEMHVPTEEDLRDRRP